MQFAETASQVASNVQDGLKDVQDMIKDSASQIATEVPEKATELKAEVVEIPRIESLTPVLEQITQKVEELSKPSSPDLPSEEEVLRMAAEAESEAAVKIQAAYRGFKTRKDFAENKIVFPEKSNKNNEQKPYQQSIIDNINNQLNQPDLLQNLMPGQQSPGLDVPGTPELRVTPEPEEAATKIQAAFRGYQVRKTISRENSPRRDDTMQDPVELQAVAVLDQLEDDLIKQLSKSDINSKPDRNLPRLIIEQKPHVPEGLVSKVDDILSQSIDSALAVIAEAKKHIKETEHNLEQIEQVKVPEPSTQSAQQLTANVDELLSETPEPELMAMIEPEKEPDVSVSDIVRAAVVDAPQEAMMVTLPGSPAKSPSKSPVKQLVPEPVTDHPLNQQQNQGQGQSANDNNAVPIDNVQKVDALDLETVEPPPEFAKADLDASDSIIDSINDTISKLQQDNASQPPSESNPAQLVKQDSLAVEPPQSRKQSIVPLEEVGMPQLVEIEPELEIKMETVPQQPEQTQSPDAKPDLIKQESLAIEPPTERKHSIVPLEEVGVPQVALIEAQLTIAQSTTESSEPVRRDSLAVDAPQSRKQSIVPLEEVGMPQLVEIEPDLQIISTDTPQPAEHPSDVVASTLTEQIADPASQASVIAEAVKSVDALVNQSTEQLLKEIKEAVEEARAELLNPAQSTSGEPAELANQERRESLIDEPIPETDLARARSVSRGPANKKNRRKKKKHD